MFVVSTRRASVFVPLQAILIPACLNNEAITSRSRQLLMMGTWLPETYLETIRGEIKNTKSDI